MTECPDDVLRARLSRIDPAGPTVPVDPAASPRAAALRERAMQSTEPPPAVPILSAARHRRRPLLLIAAAAVAAAAAAVGFGVVSAGGGAPVDGPTTLALTLPASDGAAGSCVAFEVATLRRLPMAFAGTVTATGEQVTLDVDHWYRGGDADRVTLTVPDTQRTAALDGVDFRSGERYLVAASDGIVDGCGYSGPATPQLEQAYGEAFGG